MDAPTRPPLRQRRVTIRTCGCDWDTGVFGHAYCWTPHIGRWVTKHVICPCAHCPCTICHKDR